MHMLRLLLILALTLGTTYLAPTKVARAAAPARAHQQFGQGTNQLLDLVCKGGLCSLLLPALRAESGSLLGTSAFVLQTVADNLTIAPDGGIRLSNLISLQTPLGLFELFDAAIEAELTDAHTIQRLRGTAKVPLPSLGILDNGALLAPAIAEIGLDQGRQLAFLPQMLVPDRPYFYFRVTTTPGIEDGGEAAAQALSSAITIPTGQALTFVIDLAQPQLYLDGKLALKNLNQLDLLSNLVGVASGLPFQLLDESARFHVAGALSPQAEATFLRIDGLYRIDPQFLRSWFGSNALMHQVFGSLTVGPAGALFRSQVDASIFPEQLFAGNLVLEAFVPFAASDTPNYVTLQSAAQLPLVGHEAQQLAQLRVDNLTFAPLKAPLQKLATSTRPIFVMVKDSATDALLFAARGYENAKSALTQGYGWSVEVAINSATQSAELATFTYQSAHAFAVGSSAWLGTTAGFRMQQATTLAAEIYSTTADFTSASYQWTSAWLNSGLDAATEQATAGYGVAQNAVYTTVENASNYLDQTVIPGLVDTYSSTTNLVAASASSAYEESSDYINNTIITNVVESYQNAADQVQATADCVKATAQSWWCRTTGFCAQVTCEP